MRYMFLYNGLTISGDSIEKVGRTFFINSFGFCIGDINLRDCSVKFSHLHNDFKIYNVSRRADNGK